jgi:hypothetical protein
MQHREREELALRVDLELDGALTPAEQEQLHREASSWPELEAERRRLERLHALLAESRLPVEPGFRARVMAALPRERWQARPSLAWRLPLALLAGLAAVAALLVGWGASGLESTATFLGSLDALAALAVAAVLAGSGLLAASWQGVGMAVAGFLEASPTTQILVVFGVLALNGLLFLLLRGRRPAASRQPVDRPPGG